MGSFGKNAFLNYYPQITQTNTDYKTDIKVKDQKTKSYRQII